MSFLVLSQEEFGKVAQNGCQKSGINWRSRIASHSEPEILWKNWIKLLVIDDFGKLNFMEKLEEQPQTKSSQWNSVLCSMAGLHQLHRVLVRT